MENVSYAHLQSKISIYNLMVASIFTNEPSHTTLTLLSGFLRAYRTSSSPKLKPPVSRLIPNRALPSPQADH
jgi:hypothetical protein